MSKNPKKKSALSLDMKDIVAKIKQQLDPKARANKVKFRNETSYRLGEFYTLVIGGVIIAITLSTVILPVYKFYPFNYSNSNQVKQSISEANSKATELQNKIDEAIKYESVVTEQEKRMDGIYAFLADSSDSLSFMMYISDLAKQSDITVESLVLPEDRKSAIVTNNIDITKQGQAPANNIAPNAQQGTTIVPVANTTNNAQQSQATQGQTATTDSRGQAIQGQSATKDDAYTINIKLVGMYTKLISFFNKLENTKEIIEITDVKFKPYKPQELDANGIPVVDPAKDKLIVDVSKFDMQSFKTEVEFKVKLYNKETALKAKDTLSNANASQAKTAQPNQQPAQAQVSNPTANVNTIAVNNGGGK